MLLRGSSTESYDDYVVELSRAVGSSVDSSRVSRLAKKMRPIHVLVKSLHPLMAGAGQVNPMPTSLILGGITFIVSFSNRVEEYQNKLVEMLEWMGDEIDIINKYREEDLTGNDPDIKACEIILATDILKTCIKVVKTFYDERGREKNGFILAMKAQCQDFGSKFGDISAQFKLHLGALEKRRRIVNARGIKSLTAGVGNIERVLGGKLKDSLEALPLPEKEAKNKENGEQPEIGDRWSNAQFQLPFLDESRRRFLAWLPYVNFGDIHENHFERRIPTSGDWLLRNEKYRLWKESANSDLLWIHGKPGSGKSHLAARVISELATPIATQVTSAMAYAYCTSNQTKTRLTYNNLLGTILGQLYEKLSASEGIPTLTRQADAGSKAELSRSELKEGINLVLNRLRSAFLVVDGLDECSHFEDRQFADFCNFLASLADSKDSDLCTKILIFSRPDYTAIRSAIAHFPTIRIDMGANDEDIKAYISSKVEEINSDPSPDEREGFEDIKKMMFNNASGLFLWVHFKSRHFREIGSVEDILETLGDKTEGLDELYGEELKKILNNRSSHVRDRALRALLWVKNAHRPLSKLELLEALSVKPGRKDIRQRGRLSGDLALATECADLITEVNGFYQLRHASLDDFLSSQLPSLLTYGPLQSQANEILAEICLTYISFENFEDVQVLSAEHVSRLYGQYPLLEYAVLSWGDHFHEAKGHHVPHLNHLLSNFLGSRNKLRLAIQILEFKDFTAGSWSPRNPTPLHIVAIFDLREVADMMSDVHPLLNSVDDFGHLPIAYSVLHGWRNMTKWLLRKHREELEATGSDTFSQAFLESCGAWLLHSASEEDWEDVVFDLVALGFDKNSSNALGETPLHAAATAGSNRALGCLLRLGALPDVADRDGKTPLIMAAMHMNPEIAASLLQNKADVNHRGRNDETALHFAVQNDQVELVKVLLDADANVNARCSTEGGFHGQTPLHYATEGNLEEMMNVLISRGASMDHGTECGDTPLLVACYCNNARAFDTLLRHGVDIHARNLQDGSSCLHVASMFGSLEVMELIFTSAARQTLIDCTDIDGNTPLHRALRKSQSAAAKLLIDQGARTDVCNLMQDTPLQMAIETECSDVAELLLTTHKMDLNQPGYRGRTAWYYVAFHGRTELLSLIASIPDVHLKDANGSTPLHSAALNNQEYFISEFLRLFPDTDINAQDSDGLTPLHIAATHGSKDSIELIVKAEPSSVHLKDKRGRFPLHLAALHGHLRCLEQLITPMSIEHRDLNGASALWIACIFGHQNVVEFLVRMGADANKADDCFGEPPILVALLEKHVRIVEHLLDHGAQTNVVSNRGVTLIQAAVLAGDQILLQRLLELEYGNPKSKQLATPTGSLRPPRAFESALACGSLIARPLDTSSNTSLMVAKPLIHLGAALETLHWKSFHDLDSVRSANGQLYDEVYYAAINGLGSLLETLRRYTSFATGTSLRTFDPLTEAARRGFPGFIAAAKLLGMSLRPQSGFQALRMQQDALLVASIHRNVQTAKELLISGANPTLKDCFGLRALDYATQNKALLEVFREHAFDRAPLDANSVSQAMRKSIVDFATAVKSLQSSGKESQSQSRLELSALAAGLLLLHSQSSIEQARICKMALGHDSGETEFLCDICSQRVPPISYKCTVCADVDLCPNCYSEYCASTPHTIPESFFKLQALDAKVEPVLEIMELFLTRHIELLPECLRLLGPLAERWIDARLAAYTDWESSAMSNKCWLQKRSACELLYFLDKTRRHDWIHTENGEEQPVQNMEYAAYMRRKIRSIFVSFNPRMEQHTLQCNGHRYLCLVPFIDLNPVDRACFSSEGVLHKTFLRELIEEYSTPPTCEERASISARFSDGERWPRTNEAGDPHDRTIETDTAAEDAWSTKLKILEVTRRTITDKVVPGSHLKTPKQAGQGHGNDWEVTTSHEIAWRLAHAMLGIPFKNALAEIVYRVDFTEQVKDQTFV